MTTYYLHLRRSKTDLRGWKDNQTVRYESVLTSYRELLHQFRLDHPEYDDQHIASVFNQETKEFMFDKELDD